MSAEQTQAIIDRLNTIREKVKLNTPEKDTSIT